MPISHPKKSTAATARMTTERIADSLAGRLSVRYWDRTLLYCVATRTADQIHGMDRRWTIDDGRQKEHEIINKQQPNNKRATNEQQADERSSVVCCLLGE